MKCWYCTKETDGSQLCLSCQKEIKVYEELGMKMNPVGIISKKMWIEIRVGQLKAAIRRYLDTDTPIPNEWYEELEEHVRGMKSGRTL